MCCAAQMTLSVVVCVCVCPPAETLHPVCAVGSWWLCFTRLCVSRTRLHLCRSGEHWSCASAACEMRVYTFVFLVCFFSVKVKATLLQLEVLESGIEERLNAPPAPCLSCADWFLPSAANRDSLASSSPVFTKLAGAVKGASGSRGRGGLFGDRTRRFSPHRSLSDSGSEGQVDAGSGSTPESPRKLGGPRDSLGSDSSGGLFKVSRLDSCRCNLLYLPLLFQRPVILPNYHIYWCALYLGAPQNYGSSEFGLILSF